MPSGSPRPSGLPVPVPGAEQIRTIPAPMRALSSARSKARRAAVDLLFEAEQRGVALVGLLEQRLAAPTTASPLREYTAQIVRGVAENAVQIDEQLATYSRGWAVDRMPAVDRAILRAGTWEIIANPDVPDAVAVSEATELARALSTDDSPAFVAGLLSRIAQVHSEA